MALQGISLAAHAAVEISDTQKVSDTQNFSVKNRQESDTPERAADPKAGMEANKKKQIAWAVVREEHIQLHVCILRSSVIT